MNNNTLTKIVLKSKEILTRNINFNFNTIKTLAKDHHNKINSNNLIKNKTSMSYTPTDTYLNNILSISMKYDSSSNSNHYHIPPSNLIKSLGHILVSWHIIQPHVLRWNQSTTTTTSSLQKKKPDDASSTLVDELTTLQLDDNCNNIIRHDCITPSAIIDDGMHINARTPLDTNKVRVNRRTDVFNWLLRLGRPSLLSTSSSSSLISSSSIAVSSSPVDSIMESLNMNVTEYAISSLFFQIPNVTVSHQ